MNIRRANIEDAEGIAKVHVDSWRTTYKGIISDEFLNNLSYAQRQELWKKNINNPDNVVFVVETESGEIVGFADTSKRDSNQVPHSIDLTSLYLLDQYHGEGLGRKLMDTLFAFYRENGYKKVFVDVLKDNKTKYFYEAFGAEHVHDVTIKISGQTLEESVYMWEVS